jgi:hypothetical protein
MKGQVKVAKFFTYQADDFTWLQTKICDDDFTVSVNRTNKITGAETMLLTIQEAYALKDLLNLILTKGNENGAIREETNGSKNTRVSSIVSERLQDKTQ